MEKTIIASLLRPWTIVLFVVTSSTVTLGTMEYCSIYPESVQSCFRKAEGHPIHDMNLARTVCLQEYYEDYEHEHTLTSEDQAFIQERVDSRFGLSPPESGFRLRHEIRVLSADERDRVWKVFAAMYWNGTLARFARIHTLASSRIHKGAAFLPWHRVFLTDFEEEMRKVDPNVSLPYWDHSMDNNITSRRNSALWTDCFFGDTRGELTYGHFSGWYGGRHRPIRRDAGRRGWMISKWDIGRLLKFCKFEDITTGGRRPYFNNFDNLELLHDDLHDWVGGDMGDIPTAAYDPIFWMSHAFIDLIWELFRENQIARCKVDPETDYRPLDDLTRDDQGGHEPNSPMFTYKHLRNTDGLWRNWTQVFYNYGHLPSCPDCGNSEYLYCNREFGERYPNGLCLTRTRDSCLV